MSYSVKKRRFADDNELLAYLSNLHSAPGEQIGIIAGHFMLMYDDQADCLVPMVYQDATNSKVDKFSREMAGDFPLRTFKLGLNLVQDFQEKGFIPKLALIVNDHIFQTSGWSLQGLIDKGRAGDLRYNFYRQKYPLPKSYFRELKAAGLSTDVILYNNNAGRISDILPKQTRLFSEQALRNYFDQYRRLELRELPSFSEVLHIGTKRKLMFNEKRGGPSVCLTEDGECGCSGELIEFFIRLAAKQFKTLVFFVPDECKLAVELGIKAFMHTSVEYRGELKSIFAIYGFGGMGAVDLINQIDMSIHLVRN